jgi:hypothetical protein
MLQLPVSDDTVKTVGAAIDELGSSETRDWAARAAFSGG